MIDNYRSLFISILCASACSPSRTTPSGYQGIVEYDERTIAFEAAGRIEKVNVGRGDTIADAQPLADLDDSLARMVRDARAEDVNVAKAELAVVKAGSRRQDVAAQNDELKAAIASEELQKKAHDRIVELTRTGSFAKAELDKADADLDRATAQRKAIESRLSALKQGARPEEIGRAEARVQQAAAALAVEDSRLLRSKLRAKGSGVVLDVLVKVGEFANVGTGALTVADTSHPFADVFVPEGELNGIAVGKKVSLVSDQSTETFGGVVEHVAHTTEFTPKFLFTPQERPNLVVRVKVRIDDPNHKLHAGIPAFARIDR